MRRRDLQRVGRVVGGQHDAVAVDDEAAVGHDRHHRDAVGLGLRGQVVVAEHLQVHQPRRQQPEGQQHERRRQAANSAPACGSRSSSCFEPFCCSCGRGWMRRVHRGRFWSGSGRGAAAPAAAAWPAATAAPRAPAPAAATSPGTCRRPAAAPPATTSVRGQEQRQHLQRLLDHAEPQQPAVDGDGDEAQQRVGQRVLAEQRALVHVHQQAEDEGHADAHAARLVHVPEHQRHRQQVGQRRLAAQRQHVEAPAPAAA